jgi:hypothetical protein
VLLVALCAAKPAAATGEQAVEPPAWIELLARWNSLQGDAYELDSLERFTETPRARQQCTSEGLVNYSGTSLRYAGSVRVNSAFKVRLERFELVVADVAREVYGRPPKRVRHYGAYSCRRSRYRTHRISEHALGNAIDIVGFDFGPVSKQEPALADLPRSLRGAFQVRVAKHWQESKSPVSRVHTRFLRELSARLAERQDIFRILIGPSHRGHSDHFHFDMSPWRFVNL